MPPAALAPIAIGLGGAGSAANAAGGKKASNSANNLAQQQLNLQLAQWGQAKKIIGSAFQPASDYWNSLLKGGQAATTAVGPIASQIGQAEAGARNSIQQSTPRGGEQNLAVANTYNQGFNDISRLYAGVQPLAAQNLGSLSGLAAGFNPSSNTSGAFSNYGNQQQLATQGGQGFGNLAYKGAQQKKAKPQSGGGGSGGTAGK